MKPGFKVLGRSLAVLALAVAALFAVGPYEPVELEAQFDPARFGDSVQSYFERIESGVKGLRPGAEKRVIWAGAPEARTDWAVVYLHGFSASAEEIRPVPDDVARALGANLVFTRLRGHGRDGDAMAEGSVAAWMQDVAEALAAGRAVGERLLVIGTSTGGTLAAVAALQPGLAEGVEGIVFISPNFGVQNPMAPLLTFPAARHWVPLVAGERRSFTPQNEGQARHWTTEYPSVAVFPMAALVKHAAAQDYSRVTIPALFYYSNDDRVVRPDITAKVQADWGGDVTRIEPLLTETDDRFAHVVAGDILSPGNTQAATAAILDWVKGQE